MKSGRPAILAAGVPEEVVERLAQRVAEEINDGNVHAYARWIYHWAIKE